MTDPVKSLCKYLYELLIFIGKFSAVLPCIFMRRKMRWKDVGYYLDQCGSRSLPIVLVICGLMGIILGIQAALQMKKFGTEIYVADLVGFSILKELGPLMVAMIATGRAGSSFAAEIGSMKAEEELSALSTMGIKPEAFLILPKMVAMLVALPILTVFGDFAGLMGGLIVGITYLDLPASAYWARSVAVLTPMTLVMGALKSFVYAFLITLAGCRAGFMADPDAQGVGRGATSAVVDSIFLVVIANAVLTILYSFIGY